MNPQKHSASVAEEQMLAHFRAHAPQQPAPALDQAILAAARRQACPLYTSDPAHQPTSFNPGLRPITKKKNRITKQTIPNNQSTREKRAPEKKRQP
ncbi:hypothetical protein KZ848_28615, partial [Pseudomonas aeruginosa]|nr:hypothetical protein [Pseudomonas aeruginosa]